jgi:hypothetical protein
MNIQWGTKAHRRHRALFDLRRSAADAQREHQRQTTLRQLDRQVLAHLPAIAKVLPVEAFDMLTQWAKEGL